MGDAVKEKEHKPIQQSDLFISFPWGMPGLDYIEYLLISLAEDSPFYFLQSTTEPRVGLMLVNPFLIFKDYDFDLDDDSAAQLEITDIKQVAVLCTVNASRGIQSATVNLLAPIVINTKQLLAKQIVLNDKRYSIRTPLHRKSAVEGEER